MSDTITTIEDAAAHLPELVERVCADGQPALILRADIQDSRRGVRPI